MAYKILLVDDEPDILEFVSYNLRSDGYEVECAKNGQESLIKVRDFKPDLVLLDVMMPVMDGIETCEKMRQLPECNGVIIAFLSARSEDFSQIAGLEAGADDYITKPIRPKLLISKVKSLLKRKEIGEHKENPDFMIDRSQYCVYICGKKIVLPRKEFELLSFLHSAPDRVFSREEIFQRVWGDDVVVGDRTIDVHIRKMREKIGQDYIQTIKGIGYKFVYK